MSKFIKASISDLLKGGCTLRHDDEGKLQVAVPDPMGSFVTSLLPDRLVIGTHVPRPFGWLEEDLKKYGIPFLVEDQATDPPSLAQVHPIQPLIVDDKGTLRFKVNSIVRDLYDLYPKHGLDLNRIVGGGKYSREDLVQFYQLIGYSLAGYGELQAVTDTDYAAAELMHEYPAMTTQAARIQTLEDTLESIRALASPAVAMLYGVHEDDLKHGRV